jgi:hypothetical protein
MGYAKPMHAFFAIPYFHNTIFRCPYAPSSLKLLASNPSKFFAFSAFLEELRAYAMALHTREQAPREGKASSQKPQQAVRSIFFIPEVTDITFIHVYLNF